MIGDFDEIEKYLSIFEQTYDETKKKIRKIFEKILGWMNDIIFRKLWKKFYWN